MTVVATNLPQQSPRGGVAFGNAHSDSHNTEPPAVPTVTVDAEVGSLPVVDGIETVEAGRTRMGIIVPDGLEACVAYLTGSGMINRLERKLARRSPGYPKDTYIATGLYPAGTIQDRGKGRYKQNLARVPLLYADFDLKDVRGIPKHELWEMNQRDLDDMLQAEAINVVRAYDDAGVPIHLLLSSGYGLQAFTRVAEVDQGRFREIDELLPRMHATLDDAFGRSVIDPSAKDPGRLMRLWGSYNVKNPLRPRQVRALATFPDAAPTGLHEIECACKPLYRGVAAPNRTASASLTARVEADHPIDVHAVVNLLRPEWGDGARHRLSLGLSGMLLKAGVGREEAREVIQLLGEHDDELDDRIKALNGTYDRFEKEGEEAIAGYSILRDYLRPETLESLEVLLHDLETQACKELPDFPMDVFPPEVQVFINEIATCKGVPAAMAAVPFLAATGALIGNRAAVAPGNGWVQYPGLWTVVVAPPGSAKSPTLSSVTAPLQRLQNRELKRVREQEKRVARQKSDLKAKRSNAEPIADLEVEPAKHYVTNNVTVEAMSSMLEHSSGLLINADEFVGWVRSMNQYKSSGADRQDWLSSWNGRTIKRDRKGKGSSTYVPIAVASVTGGIQPQVLRALQLSDGGEDGFVDRILPVVVNPPVAFWSDSDERGESLEAVMRIYEGIDLLPKVTDPEAGTEIKVPLSAEALEVWVQWFNENKLQGRNTSGTLGGMYRKLDVQVIRIALILHVLKHPSWDELVDENLVRVTVHDESSYEYRRRPISAETMRDAIRVGEFFRGHMREFVRMLGKGKQEPSPGESEDSRNRRDVLRAIRNKADEQGWAQHSNVRQSNRIDSSRLTEITRQLEEEGLIERQKSPMGAILYRTKDPEQADRPLRAV